MGINLRRRHCLQLGAALAWVGAGPLLAPLARCEGTDADPELPRHLTLRNLHTGETLALDYSSGGVCLPDAMSRIVRVLRDYRTGEQHEILVSGEESRVVETVPGWAHDITNIGDDEMLVMLWANELFEPGRPDTIASPVNR